MRLGSAWAWAWLLAALAAPACASLVRPAPGVGARRAVASATPTPATRLPLEVTPSSYDITLTPYLDADGEAHPANSFEGTVVITAKVTVEKTQQITLHASGLAFPKENPVTVVDITKPETNVATTVGKHETEPEWVVIQLNTEIAENTDIKITLTYTGVLAQDMDGFYVSTYQNGAETIKLAATQFEATSARKAFPCFDEPALKAEFTLTINVPEGYDALFNTDKQPETTPQDSAAKAPTPRRRRSLLPLRSSPAVRATTQVKFPTTKAMSTYLVAFVVYHKETFTAQERAATEYLGPVRVWSRKDFESQRQYALDVATASLEAYGRLFVGYKNMNDKMDQVAIPDFSAGAMENWGLVTYRERAVLIDEAQSSTESHGSVVTTIAHELAHQWFGDYVSPNFWNVLWLNEGFATYWAYHADLGSIIEGWRLRDQFLAEELAAALETDSASDTHPMTTAENTIAPFDDITYSKGGSILRMFSHWLGEDVFYERLSNYLKNREFNSGTPDDLFSALAPGEEEENVALRESMKAWTETAGYPVVNVSRQGKAVTLKQGIYQLTPAEKPADTTWPILVGYKDADAVKSAWMTGKELKLTLTLEDDEPLILNYNWTGFYRVNYDAAGWQLVQERLSSDHALVPHENRAQLLSDAFSLARSDHVGYEAALGLSRYLASEQDYLPWAVAFRAFDFLETALAPTEYYAAFQTYMQQLLEQPYAALRFSALPDDDHVTRLLRVLVLRHACRSGQENCLSAANDLSSTISAENANVASVDPDLRSTAYCVWAQDNALWDKLWALYLATTVATEKVELLTALGCSQNETKLSEYLTAALDTGSVRPQDWATVYAGVYSTPLGLEVAMNFIADNAEALSTQPSVLQKIVNGLAGKVVTAEQLDQLRNLTEAEGLAAAVKTSLEQSAIPAAEQQVAWAKGHVPAIGKWLQDEVREPTTTAPSAAPAAAATSALALLLAAVGGVASAVLC